MLVSFDIEKIEPLADGAPFGAVGAYERVIAKAKGEVDPKHPGNSGIALIDKAPLNANGKVEYTTDIFILRPKDPAKGNGRILYEVNNRGRKMLFGNIADGPQGVNDPKTLADVGNGFPMRQGYTIVWSGWDPDAPRANMGLGLSAPVATDNGKPIVEMVREEFVSGTRVGNLDVFKLSYEAVSTDQPWARLSVRERAGDERRELPRSQWSFVDARSIKLNDGKPKPGWLYEFHYEATNPKVQGLGFAATRDVVSWLRHDPAAIAATGGKITHALAIGFSQAGRYLRHHISDGFNRDEQGRKVFDGIHAHIAGIGRIFFNTPFGQPARTGTQHEDHGFPENAFPFSTATLDRSADRAGGLAVPRRRQRSQADRDQHLDRVLAEGRLAAAHRSARQGGPDAAREQPRLHDRRHPAWRPRRRHHRSPAPTSTRAIRTIPCRPCARCWWRSTNGSCRARSRRPAACRRWPRAPWSSPTRPASPPCRARPW